MYQSYPEKLLSVTKFLLTLTKKVIMNNKNSSQLEEKVELLEEFQMEELEQRFEMSAAASLDNGVSKEKEGWTILTIEF